MAQANTHPYPSVQDRPDLLSAGAQRLMLRGLARLATGHLEMRTREGTFAFGDPTSDLRAVVEVHDARTFRLGVLRGEVGFGEAYVLGYWSSPDPVAVVRVAVANMAAVDTSGGPLAWMGRALARLRHLGRDNTRQGSRRNIAEDYDLGNDFYRLWLDPTMAYSAAFFPTSEATLEEAQVAKYDRICRRLRLGPQDHVLEIGTGWGGFAIHAATHTGCRITTTTISAQQHAYATAKIQELGLQDRVEVLLKDYRDLEGTYDKAVSIEMFEAVGLKHYDTYFGAVDRLLKPGGAFLLQTITMNERRFPAYIRSTDWIQQYVFPGAELASLSEIQKSLSRATQCSIFFLEDFGVHYAKTLAAWRERFHARIAEVRELGFDGRFERLWDYYLASCEGAFRARYIGVVQMLIAKNGTQAPLLDEPWSRP